jgi:hypothetical protein
MAKKQILIIDIPETIDPVDYKNIGQDVINFIQKRAIEENTGFNPDTGRNKRFPKYSPKYAAMKGVGLSDVDLVMSSDMFNAMDVTKVMPRARRIEIGFTDEEQNAKAEGNQLGSYGREPNPKKARPFMGLTKADLNRILDKYK